MDELSIVQYYQREGKGDAKLVIIDFYKEFGSNGFPNPGIIDRCFTCNQGGELKSVAVAAVFHTVVFNVNALTGMFTS